MTVLASTITMWPRRVLPTIFADAQGTPRKRGTFKLTLLDNADLSSKPSLILTLCRMPFWINAPAIRYYCCCYFSFDGERYGRTAVVAAA